MQNRLYILLGWFFLVLGGIGVFLPVFPTTPFLILALALFSKSSPRFHQMLLNNPRFGPVLQQWEEERTLARKTKYKAIALIVLAFTISIALLYYYLIVQVILVVLAIVLIRFIWNIKE
ncbi:MAG: DUF454 domain-containing protein [Desulfobulbaceae bacterium]|nr:MAG: DUF454 domain-containing protein [Desulfobulbaceae bacterium]